MKEAEEQMQWLLLEEHPVTAMALPIQLPWYIVSRPVHMWIGYVQPHRTAMDFSCFCKRYQSEDEVGECQHCSEGDIKRAEGGRGKPGGEKAQANGTSERKERS